MVANWTPCDSSVTVSLSGHWVAARRRRKSASAAFGTLTWKGRMALRSSVVAACAPSEASTGTMVAAEARNATAARTVKLRCGATTGADAISFFVFINCALFVDRLIHDFVFINIWFYGYP